MEHQPGPAEEYRRRCVEARIDRDDLLNRWNALANWRLIAFFAMLIAVGFVLWLGVTLAWALPLALFAVFLVLVVRHIRLGRKLRVAHARYNLYEEAVARPERDWDKMPLRHRVRAPAEHPYAYDLDITGRASLLHLMDAPRTAIGERTLTTWLLNPTRAEDARARQSAAAELAPMIDLREAIEVQVRLMGATRPDPEPFLAWGERAPVLAGRTALLFVSMLSPLLLLLTGIAYLAGITTIPLWLLFAAINVAVLRNAGGQVYATLTSVWEQSRDLRHYAGIFGLLSAASFRSPSLKAMQQALSSEAGSAEEALRGLSRRAAFSIPRSAQLYWPIQILFLWDIHALALVEAWQSRAGSRVRGWWTTLGEAEACAALALLAYEHPDWTFPEIDEQAPALVAEGLGHPLLPPAACVRNDVTVGPPGSTLLVTGSNMSGKSTLLRSLGVNAVLAAAGGPVCAASLRLPPPEIWTAMRVQDSLERGVSYFMAELQRLKAVVDASRAAGSERRFIYLLDEILQGTNTAERQVAARRIILALVAAGAIGAVSTHDLTLAETPELAEVAVPVHFTEQFTDGPEGAAMHFDYQLRPGLASSTNALKLMRLIGLET